jgi:cation-transporting P-type ATPase E
MTAVPPAPGRSLAQILRANVLTRFNAILGVLFVVVLVIGPPQDALFGAVLVVNTVIGVAQELRAKRALDRLAILTAGRARAVRDGAVTEIPLDRIVLDDVLELGRGDQVPVDGTVLGADGLELDEALLTGEAEPVRKQPGDTILSGSAVVAGAGLIRADRVGGDAYAARLRAQARRFSLIRSELQQGTNQILRLVTWVMVPAGLLLIGTEFLRSHDTLHDAARGSAAGMVAMVPEGLVLLTSLAFAAGALRLARRRVLVQELAAIEGLAGRARRSQRSSARWPPTTRHRTRRVACSRPATPPPQGGRSGGLVPLFAVPAARRVLALQLPPAGILAAVASVVLAAIVALTLWRRASRASPSPPS